MLQINWSHTNAWCCVVFFCFSFDFWFNRDAYIPVKDSMHVIFVCSVYLAIAIARCHLRPRQNSATFFSDTFTGRRFKWLTVCSAVTVTISRWSGSFSAQ